MVQMCHAGGSMGSRWRTGVHNAALTTISANGRRTVRQRRPMAASVRSCRLQGAVRAGWKGGADRTASARQRSHGLPANDAHSRLGRCALKRFPFKPNGQSGCSPAVQNTQHRLAVCSSPMLTAIVVITVCVICSIGTACRMDRVQSVYYYTSVIDCHS